MKGKAKLTFQATQNEYIITLKKTNYWWLLIFLLPILLLLLQIRFHKTIVFQTIEKQTKEPISDINVHFRYLDRNFINFKPFAFFKTDTPLLTQISDNQGIAKFETSYTLFSLLFHHNDKTLVFAKGGCFSSDTLMPKYHNLPDKQPYPILLSGRTTNLDLLVLDKDDKQPIPQANVNLRFTLNNKTSSANARTFANGSAVFRNIIYCSGYVQIIATKYGYLPDTVSGTIDELLSDINKRTLFLKPIKTRIEFQVKDLKTKQPIPGVKAEMILEGTNSYFLITNTNGLGRGAFDSIAIAKTFKLHFSHPSYFDTTTQNFSVADFVKLPLEKRTFYLRPKAKPLIFRNIDKLTKQPLEGVRNVLYVNGDSVGIYYSNSDGYFSITGVKKSDKISIIASKPGYYPNDRSVKDRKLSQLKTKGSRIIPLESIPPQPYDVKPPREHCRAHFSGTLLSDIFIDGHISKIFKPDKYGEYVGEGFYPSNRAAFPNAVKYSFDAIAVDAGTRVIIYSEENFKGKVLLDVTGPALINNIRWKNDSRIKNFTTKHFSGGLQNIFPPNTRTWSSSDMRDWSKGSVKVICVGN